MIELIDVSKYYKLQDCNVQALKNVSIKVEKGDIYGVIGYSGAGKSTLIRLINYLEKPYSGTILVYNKELSVLNKKELRELRKNIGMVFQNFNLLNSKTVFENIAIPLKLIKNRKEEIERRVNELLDFVELSEKGNRYINELSGGEKQRVAIARAIANNPLILLCDEATSSLDPQTTDSILNLLQKINKEYNITIMVITHEMDVVKKICNKIAVMDDGKIIEKGGVLEIFNRPKEETTKRFLNATNYDEVIRIGG